MKPLRASRPRGTVGAMIAGVVVLVSVALGRPGGGSEETTDCSCSGVCTGRVPCSGAQICCCCGPVGGPHTCQCMDDCDNPPAGVQCPS